MKNQTLPKSQRIYIRRILFANLKKRLEEVKIYLEEVNISPAIIEEIRLSREKLHQFFAQPRYLKLCRNCKEEKCCMNDYGEHLLPGELIYFAAVGYNFPEPDWEFLEKEVFWGRPWCLFLSQDGCLLKENRRIICLRYYCPTLYKKLKKDNQFSQFIELSQKLKTANISFTAQALEKLRPKLDERTRLSLEFFLKVERVA